MYIVVRRYEAKRNSIPEIAKIVDEEYLPIVSKLPGYQAYYGVDAGADEFIAIAIFHDKAGAEESTRAAAATVKGRLAELLPNTPVIVSGPVVVQGSE